tara:strand:- start:118 stop:360 length:243 start_codon:yes stop_codon:yes gene_type:complete
MGYVGNWSNLQQRIEQTKDRIKAKKESSENRVAKKIALNDAAKNRKRMSLVEMRRKEMIYIRLFILIIVSILVLLCYYYL